jgi:tetratricopeptide (TPR) repeat protein
VEVALGPQFEELAAGDDAGRYLEPMNRAMLLFAAGDYEKARELDRRLDREAEKSKRHCVRECVLNALMCDACLFERDDEALALAEKAADVPMNTNADAAAAAVWYAVAAQRAYLRMAKDGDTEKALEDVRRAEDQLESSQCILEWLSAGTFESLILWKAGRTNEAVERIDEIVDATRQFGFEKLRATALVTRAEIAECVGDESMGAGLIKALDITRRLGIKSLEPLIYLRYGSWLLQRGDFDLAVQTWEQGFSQSEGVRLFHVPCFLQVPARTGRGPEGGRNA